MKRFKKAVLAILALGLVMAPNVGFTQGSHYFWWQVVNEFGEPYTGQTVKCSVYDYPAAHANIIGPSAKVLHYDSTLTTGTTQPITSDTNGRLHFYSSSNADVRVSCFSAYGASGQSVISTVRHRLFLLRAGINRVVRFPFITNTAVTRTGIWLPQGSVIRDVVVQNTGQTTVGATTSDTVRAHLNVGFLGNHGTTISDGAMINAHTNSALVHTMELTSDRLWMRPHVVARTDNGGASGGGYMYIEGSHRGVALARWHTSASAVNGAILGYYFEKSYMVEAPNGIELTYQTSSRTGISGHVFVFFDQLHVGAIGSGFGANY